MKITILGGCGAVGSVALKTIVESKIFSEILIADMDEEKAAGIACSCGFDGAQACRVEAIDPDSVESAIRGSDVVLNCVGPFYKYGPGILRAAIKQKINYVDVCDDFDATEACLEMDDAARKAGVSALVGMGSSPGVANVLVRFAAEDLLESVEAVDIYHAHGGEAMEGPAVVKHRIHSMSVPIPVFIDGRFKRLDMFSPEGVAFEETTKFADVGTYNVYLYPHPETITLPRFIKGIQRVTNLGLVLPPAYAELIKGVVRLGMIGDRPIMVGNQPVIPLDFAVSYILSNRDRLTREAGITEAMGCLKIVVRGKKKGEPATFVFSMSSRGRGMGEGTGIPSALGAILMATGKIKGKGVMPPEACVVPADLLQLAKERVHLDGKSGMPLMIEHIKANGEIERISL
jgi:saccharopine dehydrogenase (NAD+, L-lysine-forming)